MDREQNLGLNPLLIKEGVRTLGESNGTRRYRSNQSQSFINQGRCSNVILKLFLSLLILTKGLNPLLIKEGVRTQR